MRRATAGRQEAELTEARAQLDAQARAILTGSRPWLPARHLLHAAHLGFVDPTSGRRLEVTAPLPPDFDEARRALGGADDSGSQGG